MKSTLKIVYEDNHLIAVEKEPGIPTQDDSTGIPSLLYYIKLYLKEKYRKPGNVFLGMVQRLDKPVSGLILFAKTSKAARRINAEIKERSVVKMYAALVHNNKEIQPDVWIELEQELVRRRGYSQIAEPANTQSKKAHLAFIKLFDTGQYAFLLIDLITGKKHQIRAQLASMAMPVIGDGTYGSPILHQDRSICLHSIFSCFTHPVLRTRMDLVSSIPERFFPYMDIDSMGIDVLKKKIIAETGARKKRVIG